jgi:hypothetical protein
VTDGAELSPVARRTGWALTGLAALFLAMDAGMKLAAIRQVTETQAQLGWPADAGTARGLGLLLAACLGLYVWPRTCVLGAVLLTGYLGGAVATHVRIGSPLFSHVLFGVYVGLAVWGGMYLRDARLRALFPFKDTH